MRRVVIESPYAGNVEENVAYLKRCMLDSMERGEAPFASHLLYTQVLDDTSPVERRYGMEAGFEWARVAEAVVVYTDLGISPGMASGIARATEYGLLVEHRSLAGRLSATPLDDRLATALRRLDHD